VDAGSRLTSVAFAYGEIVWVRRPDAGVKFEGGQRGLRAMVSQKAGSPGPNSYNRKAIAQEGRMPPPNLYACVHHFVATTHARPRVRRAPGFFPAALYFFGGETIPIQLGRIAPRGRGAVWCCIVEM